MSYDNKNKGAGWYKKDKNGNDYISGKANLDGQEFYFNIFPNAKKQDGSAQPDFNILITKK